MKPFQIIYHEQVAKDIRKLKLTKAQLIKLKKKIEDVSRNPYPKQLGGLGEPLSGNLKGLHKFRFDNDFRVVYQIIQEGQIMKIVIIGMGTEKSVYKKAEKRV